MASNGRRKTRGRKKRGNRIIEKLERDGKEWEWKSKKMRGALNNIVTVALDFIMKSTLSIYILDNWMTSIQKRIIALWKFYINCNVANAIKLELFIAGLNSRILSLFIHSQFEYIAICLRRRMSIKLFSNTFQPWIQTTCIV